MCQSSGSVQRSHLFVFRNLLRGHRLISGYSTGADTKRLSGPRCLGWRGARSLPARQGMLLREPGGRGDRGCWEALWNLQLQPENAGALLPTSPPPRPLSTLCAHPSSPFTAYRQQIITFKWDQATLPRVSSSKEFFFFKKTKKEKELV